MDWSRRDPRGDTTRQPRRGFTKNENEILHQDRTGVSIKVQKLIFENYHRDGDIVLKACMVVLAWFCDDEGRNIFPKRSTIARYLGASERQTSRILAELVKLGDLLLVDFAKGGRGKARVYEISPALLKRDTVVPVSGGGNRDKGGPKPGHPRSETGTSTVLNRDNVVTPVVNRESLKERVIEREAPAELNGTLLSPSFSFSEEFKTYCVTTRPELNPILTFEKFKAHYLSVTGNKARQRDWFAAWCKWVLDERIPVSIKGGSHQPGIQEWIKQPSVVLETGLRVRYESGWWKSEKGIEDMIYRLSFKAGSKTYTQCKEEIFDYLAYLKDKDFPESETKFQC